MPIDSTSARAPRALPTPTSSSPAGSAIATTAAAAVEPASANDAAGADVFEHIKPRGKLDLTLSGRLGEDIATPLGDVKVLGDVDGELKASGDGVSGRLSVLGARIEGAMGRARVLDVKAEGALGDKIAVDVTVVEGELKGDGWRAQGALGRFALGRLPAKEGEDANAGGRYGVKTLAIAEMDVEIGTHDAHRNDDTVAKAKGALAKDADFARLSGGLIAGEDADGDGQKEYGFRAELGPLSVSLAQEGDGVVDAAVKLASKTASAVKRAVIGDTVATTPVPVTE
jgi:hypothetical protein